MKKPIKRSAVANLIAILEGGKSQAKVGDVRQILKILIQMETNAIKAKTPSPLLALRKEARIKAKAK